MKNNLFSWAAALLFLLTVYGPASSAQPSLKEKELPSVFEDFYHPNEVLEIKLQSDWNQLLHHRHKSEKQEATLSYRNPQGQEIIRLLTINTRGKSRLDICTFPPLKLHLDKKQLDEKGFIPVFNDLKLVTHCHQSARSEQQVLKEYLTYLLYNHLSPLSHRVQLVQVQYVNNDGTLDNEQMGFLIEDTDALAYRLGGKQSDRYGLEEKELDGNAYSRMLLFQYMIGNADWDLAALHNMKIIKRFSDEALVPVAYDFDFSGLVNAFYAVPNDRVRQVTLKQRVLMGHFPNEEVWQQTVQEFIAAKADLLSICENFELLDKNHRKDVIQYLKEFYDYIENPKVISRGL